MDPVLRNTSAAAAARLSAGARVGFALLGMFARELRATLTCVLIYCVALGVFGLAVVEFATRSTLVTATPNHTDWIEAARDPKLRGHRD